MSSHPGCTLDDAVQLACYMKKTGLRPEQVQDFYPTPGTMSTAMFYTGIDPRDMKPVYVPRDPHEKAMQRALMQYFNPMNHALVKEALIKTQRDDLIGWGANCLIGPYVRDNKKPASKGQNNGKKPAERRDARPQQENSRSKQPKHGAKPAARGGKPAFDGGKPTCRNEKPTKVRKK